MSRKTIAEDIKSTNSLLGTLEALRSVSIIYYQATKKESVEFYHHLDMLRGFFPFLSGLAPDNPLVHALTPERAYVLVTSDTGFMMGLNQRIIEHFLEKNDGGYPLVIGEKGDMLLPANIEKKFFSSFKDESSVSLDDKIAAMTTALLEGIASRQFGEVHAIYPVSERFGSYDIREEKLLPLARISGAELNTFGRELIVESNPADISDYVTSMWLAYRLRHIAIESQSAEYSARIIHLEKSCDELRKRLNEGQKALLKARKEQGDKGVRESTSAQAAIAKQRERLTRLHAKN